MEFAPVVGMSPGRVVVGPPMSTMVVVGRTTVVDGTDVVVGPPMFTLVVVVDGVVGGYAQAMSVAPRVIDTIAQNPTKSARRVDTLLQRSSRRRSSPLMNTESNGRLPHVKGPDQTSTRSERAAVDEFDNLRSCRRSR